MYCWSKASSPDAGETACGSGGELASAAERVGRGGGFAGTGETAGLTSVKAGFSKSLAVFDPHQDPPEGSRSFSPQLSQYIAASGKSKLHRGQF
jgi:hypothetical protein